MKSTNKMFLLGMIGILLVFGFVFTSCSEVFEGDANGDTDYSWYYPNYKTAKAKLTLTSKTYKIEWDGKTYEGNCTKASATLLGVKASVYTFTSGGEGGAEVWKVSGTREAGFEYLSTDGKVSIYSRSMAKGKSIADDGAIYVDELELIILDDEDDE